MNATPKPAADPHFKPGDSYYTVLLPTGVMDAQGQYGYHMWGPFPDLVSASQMAQQHVGALISVTLFLHQNVGAVAPAAPAPPVSRLKAT